MDRQREYNALRSYLLRDPDDPEFDTALRLFFQRLKRHNWRFDDFMDLVLSVEGKERERTPSSWQAVERLEREIASLEKQLADLEDHEAERRVHQQTLQRAQRTVVTLEQENQRLDEQLTAAEGQWRRLQRQLLASAAGAAGAVLVAGMLLFWPPSLPLRQLPSLAAAASQYYAVASPQAALLAAPHSEAAVVAWLQRQSCVEGAAPAAAPSTSAWQPVRVALPQGMSLQGYLRRSALEPLAREALAHCRVRLEWPLPR